MTGQFVLSGQCKAYRAENGTIELYAVRLADGEPQSRLYHFKTVNEGGVFADYKPVGEWSCVAKCVGGAVGVELKDMYIDGADEFAAFISALEDELEKSAALFQKRNAYSRQVLNKAAVRLSEVNVLLSEWSSDKFDDENECIEACKVLCGYLKVEPRIPAIDIAGDFCGLAEEILYLSGIRYKEVSLPENWWKHNNGAMLGHMEDGTPVALTPHRISGYRAYDPRSNKSFKVGAEAAARLEPKAIAVFRTFPAKSIGFKDVAGFILGENIYKEIVVIVLCSLFASIIQVIPPIVSAQIFDVIVPENLRSMLVEVILILIAFELANIGFFIIINLGVSRINTKAGLFVQAALWDRLLSLRIPFFSKYTAGELLQKIKGIDQVRNLISVDTLQVVFSNLFFFVNIIVLFKFSPVITVYVLLMFIVLFVVYAAANIKKYKLYKRYTELENKAMSFNHQCAQGMHRIKASCAEERVYNIWSAYEADKRYAAGKIKMIDNALCSFQLFFDFTSIAAVYFMISRIHDVAMGMFIAYISTFLIFQNSVRALLKTLNIVPELVSVCRNIKPILNATPEYDAMKTVPSDMSGTLEVNHATFRYGEYGRNVLSDISFRVEGGESVGVVGLSGGGKTTLIKILMGFYGLTAGKIYYGGYDLETIDLRYLRKQMGVVLQNGRLAVGDIYGNVTDNDNSIEYEAVAEAVRKVGLEEMVDALPAGLHTRLEECPLSDGEKQRLMIARAIVKKNKFIFLDEATSSLDNISQSMILKNLKSIPATKIIVAQRLATVQYCDKIIVMDNGEIVEQGTYERITQNYGLFSRLSGQTRI